MFRAFGIETDQEMLQLIGPEDEMISALLPTIEEGRRAGIYSQHQAIKFLGIKIKQKRYGPTALPVVTKKALDDEVYDVLSTTVLAHVPVRRVDYCKVNIM